MPKKNIHPGQSRIGGGFLEEGPRLRERSSKKNAATISGAQRKKIIETHQHGL